MIWRIDLQKARNANAAGNTEQAIEHLLQMMKHRPNLKARILCGYQFLKFNRVDLAKDVFEKHILTHRKMKKPPKYNKEGVLKINHTVMSAKINYGLYLWKTGDLEQGIKMLEEVHRKMRTTDLYCNLGYLYILRGDLDKALKFNNYAYDFNAKHNGICDNLGYTYYMRGEYDKALEIYEEAEEHEKQAGFPEFYYNYGKVSEQFGNTEKAKQLYQKALTLTFDGFSNVTREQVETALQNV